MPIKFLDDLSKAIKRTGDPDSRRGGEFAATLGNHSGTVLTGTPGRVYAMVDKTGQVITVLNRVVPNIPYTRVIVGYKDGVTQVLRRRDVYNGEDDTPQIPAHAKTHQIMGGDADFVESKRILALLAFPVEDFNVQLYGGLIRAFDGSGVVVVRNQLLDLSSYQPEKGALWLLLEADETGAIQITESAEVQAKELLYVDLIPTITSTPLWAIKLYGGQEKIGWGDLYDLRFTNTSGGWDGDITDIDVGSSADIGAALDDADQFIVYDNSASAWVRSALSRVLTYVQALTDTLYSALGHGHSNAIHIDVDDEFDTADYKAALHANDRFLIESYATYEKKYSTIVDFYQYAVGLMDLLYMGLGSDYSVISGNDAATDVTGAELEELTDGSETTLHSHADPTLDAGDITYTPTTATNWDGSADPGDTNDALDQLASRVKDNEDSLSAIPTLASGTWTPTVTKSTNVDSASAPGDWHYIRIGNHVFFGGTLIVNQTAVGASIVYVSIPITSNFTSSTDANGNATQPGTGTPNIGSIREDQVNDRLRIDFYGNSTSDVYYRCVGEYIIN